MKISSRILLIIMIALASCQQVSAKCGGACLSIDSIGNSIHQTDTAYLRAGDLLKVYAKYDYNCMYMIAPQYPQMELVFYKNGHSYDTTTIEEVIYDNHWTYYTRYYISEPGLYEVYFIGFYQPDYPCRRILVLEEYDQFSLAPIPSSMENHPDNNNFMIYPNPSYDGYINIDGKGLEYVAKIEILDIAGAKVFDATPNSSATLQIPTENFHQGLYLVRIEYQGRSFIHKVLVN